MDETTKKLYEEANAARLSGDYDTALPLLEEALATCPDAASCHWAMGHVLMNTGEFEVAIERFNRSIELDPTNARYVLDLAKMLEMLGEFDAAKPILEKIIEIWPGTQESDAARKSLAYY